MANSVRTADINSGKSGRGWKPGQSGNPRGRPRGFRSMIAAEFDAAAIKDGPAIYERIKHAALEGDMRAAELMMSRWWPIAKATYLNLPDLPKIKTAHDALDAAAHIVECAARGDVSVEQSHLALQMIEILRRTIETSELAVEIAVMREQIADR